ncbi:MAG: patatin-like phospholipase family protein [Bacteroidetes bacterium]|nr:patatin-like phospholipase family protein [Bacteroidota bacterium]
MKTRLLVVVMLCFGVNLIFAQEADTLSHPKIGLVLSGGAAKGIAHIGVLKVLEEIGITPDYITGTSMGAVVGGLYALGYSAQEISELNAQADWEMLLSDRIPLNEVVFEEKSEYKRYIVGIPIRNYEFKLPSGVIEGQQLERFFAGLMWPLPEQESYDSLPIPFHCMGVDLISGKTIEFQSGNMAESIRASMSIPSIFAPESIDTMLFVDGGVFRNFPVDEVKNMGADYVIGVYVGFDEKVTKEDLFSLSDVLSRATVFYGIFDSKRQMQKTDLLIQPNLHGLGATDFTKNKRIEVLGEVSALEIQDELYRLADSLNLKKRTIRKIDQPEKIFIKEIKVINDRPFVADRFIIKRSKIKEGSYVSKNDLLQAMDNIYGTQYFRKVTYSLEKLEDDTFRLYFKVKESTRAFLNFAAHYDNQYGPGIITNLTLRNYLTTESRATVTLNIAENPGARVDINKYWGKNQRIMDNIFLNWNQNENGLFENAMEMGTYRFSYLNMGIGTKYSISYNQQIGVLGFYEINKLYPQDNLRNYFNVPSFENYGYDGFAYELFYKVNTTDDNFFPTRGINLNAAYKYNFEPSVKIKVDNTDKVTLLQNGLFTESVTDYYSANFDFDVYANIYKKVIFNIGISAGITSDASPELSNYVLGGYDDKSRRISFVPFAGLNIAEAIVPNYGLVQASFDFQIVPRVYISSRANIGFYTESVDDYLDYIKYSPLDAYIKGFCLGIRVNTVAGPINIMYGDNDVDGQIRWYVSIGYPF